MMTEQNWRKSSYSSEPDGDCMEITSALDRLRDSKNPAGPTLSADVAALIAAVKTDRLSA